MFPDTSPSTRSRGDWNEINKEQRVTRVRGLKNQFPFLVRSGTTFFFSSKEILSAQTVRTGQGQRHWSRKTTRMRKKRRADPIDPFALLFLPFNPSHPPIPIHPPPSPSGPLFHPSFILIHPRCSEQQPLPEPPLGVSALASHATPSPPSLPPKRPWSHHPCAPSALLPRRLSAPSSLATFSLLAQHPCSRPKSLVSKRWPRARATLLKPLWLLKRRYIGNIR